MTRATTPRIPIAAFAVVEDVRLTLPGVAVATKYDGSTGTPFATSSRCRGA